MVINKYGFEYNITRDIKELKNMEKKLIGVILVSVALGMFVAKFVPWWGYVAAFIMAAAGILLIMDKKC